MRRLFVLALLLVGCHASGTWVDDQANLKRAFGSPLPKEAVLVRSWYWRSSHFFREEAYYFALSATAELEKSLMQENRMRRVDRPLGNSLQRASCFERPSWFPTAEAESYEIWLSESASAALYRRAADGLLYLSACHL